MRKSVSVLFAIVCSLVLVAGNALALDLGANITIWDKMGSGESETNFKEDNEVEPGCTQGQKWDLEAFFLNDTTLTMVGGYNFKAGEGGYASGGIFIDVDGNAEYGSANTGSGGGNGITTNTFGYDYVLDLDFSNLVYSVYELIEGTSTVKVYFGQNDESNPWAYNAGGHLLGVYGHIDFYKDKDGLDTVLNAGDEIALFPPVSGG